MPIDDAQKYSEPINVKRSRHPSGLYTDPQTVERPRGKTGRVRKKPKKEYHGLLGNGSKKIKSVF